MLPVLFVYALTILCVVEEVAIFLFPRQRSYINSAHSFIFFDLRQRGAP